MSNVSHLGRDVFGWSGPCRWIVVFEFASPEYFCKIFVTGVFGHGLRLKFTDIFYGKVRWFGKNFVMEIVRTAQVHGGSLQRFGSD